MGHKLVGFIANDSEELAIVEVMQKEVFNFLAVREKTIEVFVATKLYSKEEATKKIDRVIRDLSIAWEKTPYEEEKGGD